MPSKIHWLKCSKGVHQFMYFLPQCVHQIPIVPCSCMYAFPLQLATIRTPVYALDPIAIKMNICMRIRNLVYTLWQEVPKLVYAFWTLQPVNCIMDMFLVKCVLWDNLMNNREKVMHTRNPDILSCTMEK